jgi:hypothetical protein
MSKRANPTVTDDGKLTEHEAEKLLDDLCVKYGFCLPPLWKARLMRNPPRSIDKFLDTVIRAEGLNPITVDTSMHKAMRQEVRSAFERSRPTNEVPNA